MGEKKERREGEEEKCKEWKRERMKQEMMAGEN